MQRGIVIFTTINVKVFSLPNLLLLKSRNEKKKKRKKKKKKKKKMQKKEEEEKEEEEKAGHKVFETPQPNADIGFPQ